MWRKTAQTARLRSKRCGGAAVSCPRDGRATGESLLPITGITGGGLYTTPGQTPRLACLENGVFCFRCFCCFCFNGSTRPAI